MHHRSVTGRREDHTDNTPPYYCGIAWEPLADCIIISKRAMRFIQLCM